MFLKIAPQAFEAGHFLRVLGVFKAHFLIKIFLERKSVFLTFGRIKKC